ncbi:prepilin-type N-terminal cleavage/methylation domain-containing protein [Lentibacillus sp. CBA3610]|uniref:prepilin-type N-terminal cleavage/methylation domain-containing protein n=1 Tax=Lentibacillus sp. CBA3610 TaxID=2518176 RepID=UPI0015954563|nr:prepilin-type N-terminal cleavage/methylation domain-containing protein [Lentibacillus sp. CBA3610]
MRNSKGFSLIEALVAASLLMMMITTLIPATNLLLNERENLRQKRYMINELQHELQPFLWEASHDLPHRFLKTVDGSEAEFRMTPDGKLVKGCVTWSNVKNRTEEFCLYGYPDQ